MIDYTVNFSPELARRISDNVQLASEIWKDAQADYDRIRIAAGNYAGYGRYLARCHPTGLIEFPIGNRFGLLEINENRQLVAKRGKEQALLGTLVHEVGHHVVSTARSKPWKRVPNIGDSTHLHGEWIWICCTAWNYCHNLNLDAWRLARNVSANRDEWKKALKHFSPFVKPPALEPDPNCKHCGNAFQPKRRHGKFCSDRCRVAHSRNKSKTAQK